MFDGILQMSSQSRRDRVRHSSAVLCGVSAAVWICACGQQVTTIVPPTASAGPDQVAIVGTEVTLDATASSTTEGTGALEFLWSVISFPPASAVVLSDPGATQPTFVPDVSGEYILRLVVSTASVASLADVVMVQAFQPLDVVLQIPPDRASDVPNDSVVGIAFSEAVQPESIHPQSFRLLNDADEAVSGMITLTEGNTVAVFRPDSPMPDGHRMRVVVTRQVVSLAGHTLLANYRGHFVVGNGPDSTRPMVIAVDPVDGQIGVPLSAVVVVTFSEPVDPTTIDANSLRAWVDPLVPLGARLQVLSGNTRAALVPDASYLAGTTHFIRATTAITDRQGNPLDGNGNGGDFESSFQSADSADRADALPTVEAIYPGYRYDDVPLGATLAVTFSERVIVVDGSITLATASGSSLTLLASPTAVATRPTWLVQPPDLLQPLTEYHVHVLGTGVNAVTNLAGVPLDGDRDGTPGGDFVSSFTTTNNPSFDGVFSLPATVRPQETLLVNLSDRDLDITADRDAAVVTVRSSNGETELLTLDETQDQSGVFEGSLPIPFGTAAVDGDGVVHVLSGDRLTFTYDDMISASRTARVVVGVVDVLPSLADILIGPISGDTTEAQASSTFAVSLNSQCAADVTVTFDSDNPAEGQVAVTTLTFTPADWNIPQNVVVSGVDDAVDDGDQTYAVVFGPTISLDPAYATITPAAVAVTNIDNDTAGATTGTPDGSTTEAGGLVSFTLTLDSEPTAEVTIDYYSDDPSEGALFVTRVVFSPANWSTERFVLIEGVDDTIRDFDQTYAIAFEPVESADPNYAGLVIPSVVVTNLDDDSPAIFAMLSGDTTESGGTATLQVFLSIPPTANVSIAYNSSDPTEGTLERTAMTFTPLNWNIPQTAVIAGVDDPVDDGNQRYLIVSSPAATADPDYLNLVFSPVWVTNIDDDTANVLVGPISGNSGEPDNSATFTLALASEPTDTVVVSYESDTPSEGTVSPTSVTFTTSNWSTAQTVTVTGVDDFVDDGQQPYAIVFASPLSSDAVYSALTPAPILTANTDDDIAAVVVGAASKNTTEMGGTATFTAALNSEPIADVTLSFDSSDPTEGTPNINRLTFTPLNWNLPQTVTVTGMDDVIDDGIQAYSIVFSPTTSLDPLYDGNIPLSVTLGNNDDDMAEINVSAISTNTTEAGGAATFTVVLATEPVGPVTVNFDTDTPAEGTVNLTSLTFTTLAWSEPQTVTVTGVDDAVDDDDQGYAIAFGETIAVDTRYQTIVPAPLPVTNVDDDTAGITVIPFSGVTTEAGGRTTVAVVLDCEPREDVALSFFSTDTSEATLTGPTLTFTNANWDIPQSITVTGVDDFIDDGDVIYNIEFSPASSLDPKFQGLVAGSLGLTNVDDDFANIVPSAISNATSEAGTTATFTVICTAEPTANVTVGFMSDDLSEGVPSPGSLTFTSLNWSTARTVTVVGLNDSIADGPQPYSIVFDPASSGDAAYNGLATPSVAAYNYDDDVAMVEVSAITGETTESGGLAAFTVGLTSEPTAEVTISFDSDDPSEGVLATTTLIFTALNWASLQTVTVAGVDDVVIDGNRTYNVVFSPSVSSDPNYGGQTLAPVAVTNVDDDAAGVTVSGIVGDTSEAGGTAIFTVRLDTQPTAVVIVDFDSGDPSEGTVAPTSLTFNPLNWSTPQTVTVAGVDDPIQDGDQPYLVVFLPATSPDLDYDGLVPTGVTVINIDDDLAAINVSSISGSTSEAGDSAMFTVVLNSEPTASVVVNFDSNNLAEGAVGITNLTFNALNWSTPQSVTVIGVDDSIDDGDQAYGIAFTGAGSTDANYSGMVPSTVAATNVDDDTAGITVSPISGSTTEAGGTATFTVVLATTPVSPVSLTFSSNDATEGGLSTTTLLFDSTNWDTPLPVTVTGLDDTYQDGDQAYAVVFANASSLDPLYSVITPASVAVINVDDDVAGATASATPLTTNEGGSTSTVSVVLNSTPSASVTLSFFPSDPGEGAISMTTLNFTPVNWDTPQTFVVTGQDDFTFDGNQIYQITFAPALSTDPGYSGYVVAPLTLTNIDDDTPGITASPAIGSTTEAGGTATFTVALNTSPAASVALAFDSNDLTEGTLGVTTLTFDDSDWNIPRTVTVTGVSDNVDDGDQVFSIVFDPATSADPAYVGMATSPILVTNLDDDLAGISVGAISGDTNEAGSTATLTVVLDSEPTSPVTIDLDSSNVAEGTVSTTRLDFTSANWSVAQTVTVTGQDDLVDDGDRAYAVDFLAVTSLDLLYSGYLLAPVGVTNLDDDLADITVTPITGDTSEAGATATFTVQLTSEPTADVTVEFDSSDITEGTVNINSLLFTAGNWSVPQTVTLTGENDSVDDDDVAYAIVFSPVVSTDFVYWGKLPATISLQNLDDDIAGITCSAISGATTEGGGTATFTVVLDTEPIASVTVPLSSDNTAEGTVAAASVTFTTLNWDTPQTVTVAGVEDFIDDDDVTYSIVFAGATSTDLKYSTRGAPPVTVVNTDDDAAAILLSAISDDTREVGAPATFTVVLDSEPLDSVTFTFDSSDLSEGTVNVTTLVFSPLDWNIAQTVTVTGVDDLIADGDQPYTIVFNPTSSPLDPLYNLITPPPVAVVNLDNDIPGITVSAISNATTELGGTATFTVVIDSVPTDDVTVHFDSSDLTEGTVDVTSLLFTPVSWEIAQTVTVTGVDDLIDDDAEAYAIVFGATTTTDPNYLGRTAPSVAVTNTDNDTAVINVSPISGTTSEAGQSATFTVSLGTEPTADVTVNFDTSDPSEATLSSAGVTFTSANWSTAQTVTVLGQDDFVDDGDQAYTINFAPTASADPIYLPLLPTAIPNTNLDNDTAGFTVGSVSGTTDEAGATATFTARLTSEPSFPVTVNLNTSDPTEGSVSAVSLLFTDLDWSTPQTVTVTGQDDDVDDDDQAYAIVFTPSTSTDPRYSGATPSPPTLSMTNLDNDTAGVTVAVVSTVTSETGGTASFTVALDSEPLFPVSINVSSSDVVEAWVSAATLTFTPANWSTPQTVTVTGVDDQFPDGDQTYTIDFEAPASTDAKYGAVAAPGSITMTNVGDGCRLVINEVVTDPKLDWSNDAGGDGTAFSHVPGHSTVDMNDQWIEIYDTGCTVDMSGFTLSMGDTTPYTYTFGTPGDGQTLRFSAGGNVVNFQADEYLVIGAPSGTLGNDMEDTITITLRDAGGSILDEVIFSSTEAPLGSLASAGGSVSRIPNADDNDLATDWNVITSTLGTNNDCSTTATIAIPVTPGASTSSKVTVSTMTWSHDVPAGADRVLVVGAAFKRRGTERITSATFGGLSLTKVASQNGTDVKERVEMWMLHAPPVGLGTVTLTFANLGEAKTAAGSVLLTGVSQNRPLHQIGSANGDSNESTVSLTPTLDGTMVIDVTSFKPRETATEKAGQTQQWRLNGEHGGGMSTIAPALPGPMSVGWNYSGGGLKWENIAAALAPQCQ